MHYRRLTPEFKQLVGKSVDGFLEVRTDSGEYHYLVPRWIPGLLCASKSRGRAFTRLVRGKYSSVKLGEN